MIGRGTRASAAPLLALCSAVLFGSSTPLAKLLLGSISPWLLAGLLYAGSGIGLALFYFVRESYRAHGGAHGTAADPAPGAMRTKTATAEAKLRRSDVPVLAAVTLSGGIIAPVLLLLGLNSSSAASTALLLNLESLFTLGLAWIVFHENLDARIGLGAAAIIAGAIVLSWRGGVSPFHWGTLAIAGACLAWGIDNNLTRTLSASDPVQITMIKSLVAGVCNLVLALSTAPVLPSARIALAAGALGLFAYGVSIVMFVLALRELGTARTGAYFSISSFVGAALAIPLLGEPLSVPLLIAALLMAVGLWLLVTERHEHVHEHPEMLHEHRHDHDIHHQHAHRPDDPPGEPHTHVHAHARLQHSHPHFPDIHHRHRHHRES
jgi:drug/metabolite transporter (DMT)-like permease